ncbi:hypothetical protein V757_02590 [Pelistega indica]|uniref:Uncharacterized protein n=1 Tax=Pelistega indica TaxID=1414851 RepID=V8G9C1_9BURK|nr:hypothetical protein V757_02590 [Pelistega indica]
MCSPDAYFRRAIFQDERLYVKKTKEEEVVAINRNPL